MPESPDWRAEVRARLAGANLNAADAAELVEEVAQHLEQHFIELAATIGATAARERLLAQLRDEAFDGAVAGKRRRAMQGRWHFWRWSSVLRDGRYGVRSLRRNPATLVAGSTALALGIGLTAMMFSIIYGLLIKGLPYDDPSRIAVVKYIDPHRPGVDAPVPLEDFAQYRAEQRPFEIFAAYSMATVNVSGGDRPDRLQAARVTPGVIEASRVRPALGRTFGADDAEPGAPSTAILSNALWRDRFASNLAVVGQVVRVNGRPHAIIGIMPPDFAFPENARLWVPEQRDVRTVGSGDGPMVIVVGRLRLGESYENANAEFTGLAKRVTANRTNADSTLRMVVLPFVRASVNPRFYTLMSAMLAAVFLVLLVACANVANLLLDRTANRTREIGIRVALGASRLAIVRQSLVESAILAGVAAVIGTLVAQIGLMVFNRAVAQSPTPLFWMDVRLHPVVLAFVVVVAISASFVSGVLPSIQSARLDINTVLKDESQAASSLRIGRLSRAIVVVEIAISSAILLASGFLTRSIVNLRDVRPGFVTDGIVTARVTLTTTDSVRERHFFTTLDRELSRTGAYLGNALPGAGWIQHHAAIEGRSYTRAQELPVVRTLAVTPGFFSIFHVPILRGRGITAADRAGAAGAAVVSESFVRRHFAKVDPIGQRVRVSSDSTAPWLTIVGVMPTLFAATFDDPWPPEMITSFWQQPRMTSAALAVPSRGDASTAAHLREIIAAIDPETPVYAIESMTDVMKQPLWFFHIFATIFVVFGVAALVLSSIGLYAVMTFSVSRRVREMGIRLALGATARDVVGLVMRQGMTQIVVGMAIGFLVGSGIVQIARGALFGVRPNDPLVLGLVAAVLGGTAVLACFVPALRATRVDPVVTLRAE